MQSIRISMLQALKLCLLLGALLAVVVQGKGSV